MIRKQVEFLQKSRKRKYLTEINNNLDDDDTGQDDNDNVEVEPAMIPAQVDDEGERPVVRFESGKTQKGGICLWFEGYRYIKMKAHYWTCSLRGCPANATIVKEDESGMSGTIGLKKHTHLPEPQKQEAEARRQKIKECVKEEPRLKPTRLLAQVRRSAPEEAYVAMKSDNALREMMRRQKRKILGNVDSTDPLGFVIPAVLREKRGEDIVLYDSRNFRPNERDVVLIFGSEKTLEILRTNRTWHIDGTFKCAPALWKQCFVIGASVYHRMCICIWALLPGKNKKYYDEVLLFLREKIAPATPSKILTDFEKAELLAVRATFPTVDILCCMFHYGQSIFRSFKRLGLVPLYGQKNERGDAVRNSFRSVLSLPLLPPTVIRRAFALIVDASPNGLEEFFLYFARTYIGLTHQQTEQGAGAFECSARRSVDTASDDDSSAFSEHCYSHIPAQFGLNMSSPSAASWPATTASQQNSFSNASSYTIHQERLALLLASYATSGVTSPRPVQRWKEPIARRPIFPIELWNMNAQAGAALARTNNGLEATHLHFMKGLSHHPALSDFVFEVNQSIDKQVDAARSARHFAHKRHKQYIIQDAVVMRILSDASYDSDADILDLMSHLGLQVEGYAGQLKDLEENINDSINA